MGESILFKGRDKEASVTHRQLCKLVREVWERRKRSGNRITLIDLVQQHERCTGITLDENVRRAVIYKTATILVLPERAETVVRSLVEGGFEHVSFQDWRSILDRVVPPRAALQVLPRDGASMRSSKWLDLLGRHVSVLSRIFDIGYTSQDRTETLAGEYFIVRRITVVDGYLVSHMSVRAGTSEREASVFTTSSVQRAMPPDAPFVDGIIYQSGHTLFSLGKIRDSSEIRAAVLARRPREQDPRRLQKSPA